jgi:outer membrane protein OmpA-like peptidoglycan-associated protein
MPRWITSSALFLISVTALVCAPGCVATRDWVRAQLDPVNARLGTVDAKADRALAGIEHLQLEKKMVLGMKEGATFGFNSAGLSGHAKSEIDRFLKELEERSGTAEAPAERVFVVAGHTDSSGKSDYNYELGQRRAERVAGYLVSEKGVDPLRVHVVSYGNSKPTADNTTLAGRRENRRIEILVYQEKIGTSTSMR